MTCPIERDAGSDDAAMTMPTCATASFLKELDFTPTEWRLLLDLAADLKARQVRRHRGAAAERARTSR